MHRSTWKRAERRAAKVFGAKRVPFSGGLSPGSTLPKADLFGGIIDRLFPTNDVKHRRKWDVQGWIRSLRDRSRPHGYWLLIVGTPEMHGQYAILPLDRLVALIAEAEKAGEDAARHAVSQGAAPVEGTAGNAPPQQG